MASKRNLYRPAQENVGQRKPRRTLAQGRFISGSSSGPQKTQTSATAVPPSPNHVSTTPGGMSRLHTSLMQGQPEESFFSPRRSVPQASEPKSPRRGPPADSLDLSDSEDYAELPDERKRYQMPSDVLFMDASRQTIDADMSEVDIRIGVKKKSDVKVICHSPARVNDSSRYLGDLENLTQDNQANRYSPQVVKARQIIREKLSDNPNEPLTAVQSIPMSPSLGSRRILQTLPSNLPQPNFDDTSDSDVLVPSIIVDSSTDIHDNLSVISDIVSDNQDRSSVKEVKITNHKKDDSRNPSRNKAVKATAPARKTAVGRLDTDKKKKGTVIPSRYMQSAESKAKMSLSARMEKSTLEKSNRTSRSINAPNSAKKPILRKYAGTDERTKTTPIMDRPQTPENQSIASSAGGKTSTPTNDGTLLGYEMDIDASAIHAEMSLLAGDASAVGKSSTGRGKTRSRIRQHYADELMGQTMTSKTSLLNQTKPKQKVDIKALQLKLDMLSMYNLQWAFLEAKAKKALEDQDRQAMAQIFGIHEEVEKLRNLKAEREQYLAKSRHMNRTDHMTEVQRQCLGPVINNLVGLKRQHQCLAEALDTTRHQIATKDIHLPDNEDQYQAKIEAQLLESERLLGEIGAVTGQNVPKVKDMADAIVTMESAVDNMETELKKSRELLAATETLTMHECSLRVQEIQLMDLS